MQQIVCFSFITILSITTNNNYFALKRPISHDNESKDFKFRWLK